MRCNWRIWRQQTNMNILNNKMSLKVLTCGLVGWITINVRLYIGPFHIKTQHSWRQLVTFWRRNLCIPSNDRRWSQENKYKLCRNVERHCRIRDSLFDCWSCLNKFQEKSNNTLWVEINFAWLFDWRNTHLQNFMHLPKSESEFPRLVQTH